MEREQEYEDAVEVFRAEAVKNAVKAFNEGYLLGMKHAEMVFGKVENEDPSK